MSTEIMGIVNLTPDSFSDGGQIRDKDQALRHIEAMIKDGADIIDIGAESSRPGAKSISADEEIERLAPLLKCYKTHFDTTLSLDSTKAKVAEFGLAHGVDYINDISALTLDPDMAKTIAKHKAGAILMHMKGTPSNMQENPEYEDLISTIYTELESAIQHAKSQGISELIIDPGIGFGKTVTHNLKIIKELHRFKSLNAPILIGNSNKSFIGHLTDTKQSNDRLEGTIAANVMAITNGANILRVHNVKAAKRASLIADAILEAT